jgi:hypothetical protein
MRATELRSVCPLRGRVVGLTRKQTQWTTCGYYRKLGEKALIDTYPLVATAHQTNSHSTSVLPVIPRRE